MLLRGLTDLPWRTWLLIATVGRLPSIVTSTVGGSALGEQNYRAAVIAFAIALAVAGWGISSTAPCAAEARTERA